MAESPKHGENSITAMVGIQGTQLRQPADKFPPGEYQKFTIGQCQMKMFCHSNALSAIYHLNGYFIDLVLGPDHSRSSSPYPLQVFIRLEDQGFSELEFE